MTAVPRRASAAVHRNRVMRLMSPLGWAAIDPKPLLSRPDPDHGIDRYWRRGVTITRPDQVWRTDSPLFGCSPAGVPGGEPGWV